MKNLYCSIGRAKKLKKLGFSQFGTSMYNFSKKEIQEWTKKDVRLYRLDIVNNYVRLCSTEELREEIIKIDSCFAVCCHGKEWGIYLQEGRYIYNKSLANLLADYLIHIS